MKIIGAFINAEIIAPVTLPVVAEVYGTRKTGKFSVDLNIDPQRTGEHNRIGVYPDKSWTDVRPGYALIEKITYKAENFAFVKGHMLDETNKVSLSHFINKCEHIFNNIYRIFVHDYDAKEDTGVIEYRYGPGNYNPHHVIYAILNDDGTVMKYESKSVRNTPYENDKNKISVTPDELKILSRFRSSMTETELSEELSGDYGVYDCLYPLENLPLGEYAASVPATPSNVSKLFKRAMADGIISTHTTSADTGMYVSCFCAGQLHKLFDYYNAEIDSLATEMQEMNRKYAEFIKSLIKKRRINIGI